MSGITTMPGDGRRGNDASAAIPTASGGGPRAVQLPEGFTPYAWAATVADVAARHGLQPAEILKFDQNTPALPGVPQIPLADSFATLNQYPDGTYRELREAAAGYVSRQAGVTVGPEQIVVGAGADDLILLCARTYLEPGRTASIRPPTYALYRIATLLAGAGPTQETAGASIIWRCNPDNPTGAVTPITDLAELARANPTAVIVVDEAYVEYGGETAVALVDDCPNLVVLRTMSKAFGYAALRVGYAVAAAETAAVLEARRAPAPISVLAARIAAAALRDPRYDLAPELAERERVREALVAAGFDAPPGAGNFVWIRTDQDLAGQLEAQGIIVRRFPQGIRVTVRRPSENDVLLRALGAEAGSPPGRETTVIRTSTETALRITLSLDGSGRSHVVTGIGFLDHLLTLLAFHAGFDLDCVAGGDLEVDEHHTVEDVLAAFGTALQQALGSREGVARYGSAVVPMDEARAIAAVDLVRRAHAEISLGFSGDRVGGLALSLLPHALERFTMEAGCTVHVESAGDDDHHVAEAAFKALGQALRQAVAAGDGGDPVDQGDRVRVVLADYGAGNLRSVTSAFARAGADASISTDPAAVTGAPLAVIAGVGHVESAARGLAAHGLDDAIRDRVAAGRPVLGICVGMQLLFEESEEGGHGLGLLEGPVRRVRARRVPHMGWNDLAVSGSSALVDGLGRADVYFAHSFAVEPLDEGVVVASVEHDGRVVAAVEQGAIAGVQFHPERSARAGARLLENALAWSRSV